MGSGPLFHVVHMQTCGRRNPWCGACTAPWGKLHAPCDGCVCVWWWRRVIARILFHFTHISLRLILVAAPLDYDTSPAHTTAPSRAPTITARTKRRDTAPLARQHDPRET